jgi:thymidylate kinase
MNQIFIFFKDGGFLQVDCLYRLIRKDLVYLSNDYLRTQKVERNGVNTYSNFCLFEHTILFNQLNFSGISKKYFQYFLNIPAEELSNILNQFNAKYKTEIFDLFLLTSYQKDLRMKLTRYVSHLKANNLFQKLISRVNYFLDSVCFIRRRRGFLISFSGVDGAGKSTILEATRRLLSEKFRKKTIVIRHRPSLFPILSSFIHGKKLAENRAASRLPRQGKNTSQFNSLLRFSYYYTDYLFGRGYILFKYQLRNYIVLYDRYYFDFIIDGKRTNLELNQNLSKWLYRFVQKPRLNFFLYAPAEIILQRKQELLPEAIESLTQGYKSIFSEFGEEYNQAYHSIENIKMEKTLNFISKQLIKEF